jgi:hypothetical protein
LENFLDKTTQFWVKLTGRKIDPIEYDWLVGPLGDPDLIGDKFIKRLAIEEKLETSIDQQGYGLIDNFSEFKLSNAEKDRIHPAVIDFYENTSDFNFDFWSEWKGIFKPFGWLLSIIFSKRLQQLNLPLNAMDSARGLDSNIIKLKKGSDTIWTIWFRKLKANNRVIYSGIYTICEPSHYKKPLLKVIFPLPNGNASVIMTKQIGVDGSLTLSSDGNNFGENGFYFTLKDKKGTYWAKYVKQMHEWIKVFVDNDGVLRADHDLNFMGMRFLSLHYKMTKK